MARARSEPNRRVGPRLADFSTDKRVILLVALAIVIGSLAAVAAFALIRLIALVSNLVWFGQIGTTLVPLGSAVRSPWMVAAPIVGGIVIGFMARFGSQAIRGHGIPEAIEVILIGKSRIAPRVALLKPISAAISIGTGGPFGAEGPIIMTGGAIGSLFAQWFTLSASERKTLLVAGAAAGMTAIFGTPAAGVLLALELLLFEWKPRSLIPVSTAASTAIVWRPLFFGSAPLFPMAPQPALTGTGFLLCGLLGLGIGALSGLLTKTLYLVEDRFEHLKLHWMWWPALGGIVVGLGGLVEPRALGVGYGIIADMLQDRLAMSAALTIFGVKALIWLVALGSGTSGGVLAPLLILGGCVGYVAGHVLPGMPPALFALIGMAAILGGTMRAPLTGAVFAVEVSGLTGSLPAALLAAVAAYGVTVLLLRRSILTEKIARRGRHITQEYAIDPYELARAADVMVSPVTTLQADLSVHGAAERAEADSHTRYPVIDEHGRVTGIVERATILAAAVERARTGSKGGTVATLVGSAAFTCAEPEHSVSHVLDLMIASDVGLVPIIDPRSLQLKGIITRKDVLAVRRNLGIDERERARFYFSPLFPRSA